MYKHLSTDFIADLMLLSPF